MQCTRLKTLATALGIERLVLKNNRLLGYFISDQESAFYQSAVFGRLLQFVQTQQGPFKLKEKETRNGLRLLLTIEGITSVGKGLEQLAKVNA